MSPLVWAAVTAAAGGSVVSWLAPAPRRSLAAGIVAVLQATAGVALGVAVLGGARVDMALAPRGTALAALGRLTVQPTALGALFLVVMSAVALVAAVFAIGYVRGPSDSRTAWTSWFVFVAGLQLVAVAGDAVSFLLGWELMALGSTALVFTEHAARTAVRSAGLWYAAMTHLSFLLVLSGMAVLAGHAGSVDLDAIAAARPGGHTATLAWLLLATGFLTKAGAVPLHVWLPRAHPEAPSHVSAVMSGAMVKAGVYGLLLVSLRLLPAGPRWWAVALLVVGLVSAAYGILQASVTSDLKRLLAYSTTENVGLMITTIGLADLYRAADRDDLAQVALVATGLLVVSHAAFKTLLFLVAGSVLHATGERDLDRLGGLGPRMPVTSVTFAVGALAAAALPVTSGFVAEWVLLQALVRGGAPSDPVLAALLPAAMGVVALTAGLALLTFAKAFGIGCLARPRSDGATAAHEGSRWMGGALVAAAAVVVGLGIAPGPLSRSLASALAPGAASASPLGGVSLPGLGIGLDPLGLTLLALGCAAPVLGAAAWWARRAPRRRVELGWGCGGARVSPRMQYTATSYAEPLVRVFGQALDPRRELEVEHYDESRHLIHGIRYRHEVGDPVESGLYARGLRGVAALGERARSLQNGSIQRYLGYSFGALLVVLLVVSAW
ncbi:proton-conducting transporter membrane subunit [Nocardioides sp.]|uniref:proton-conducting transporter transmembrane domain-containing protein n=1 Tax=Nocardioides sp. TaxID=35761 RepID=UPI003527DB59